jgi:Rod binding domain-containing protein
MGAIGSSSAASVLSIGRQQDLPMALKRRDGNGGAGDVIPLQQQGNTTEEVREKFTQFVGETFYGQMFKAMRSTVGKPAYFNGGRAEEVFQGQLDQTMSQQLTKTTASKFAEPMFERQFPRLAEVSNSGGLNQLDNLSRR